MNSFDRVYNEAEIQRNRWHCRRAVKKYRQAEKLAATQEERCKALHMMGVTLKMSGALRRAELALLKAMDAAEGDLAIGNILRDLADVLSLLGQHETALDTLDVSMRKLIDHPVPFASSLGFKGRVLQRMGRLPEALTCFELAHEQLRSRGEGAQELFNLVYYINALYEAGEKEVASSWLYPAAVLCQEHGAWSHRLRLTALRYGGHHADNLVQKLLPLRRFIPV